MEKFIHDENITIKKDLPQLPRQASRVPFSSARFAIVP